MMKVIHRPMIIHINRHLLVRLTVQHSERGSNFDLIIVARPKKRANHSVLAVRSAKVMVEDGEQRDGMNCDIDRCASVSREFRSVCKKFSDGKNLR
jgi:hypothetical protein